MKLLVRAWRPALISRNIERNRNIRMLSGKGSTEYDVVVIGGGHAGTEAAAAAARIGARTALLTQRLDTIGEMSCNPSIGGIGKGHLVKEIDAMGGVMGSAIDQGGIHFRMLNRRKGEAVWGPRAQADRDLYKAAVQRTLVDDYDDAYLCLVEDSAEDLVLENGKVKGVIMGSGNILYCQTVVLTTGTFLRGRIYLGLESYPAGRHERPSEDEAATSRPRTEPAANALANLLENRLQLPLGRLKTGTPPRLDGRTIDWDDCDPQPSENPPFAFSFINETPSPQGFIQCYRTGTNADTHAIVMNEKDTLAPPSTDGTGPRYCPSIYKKVERFGHRSSHGVWLEPEGLNTNLVYPNGLSGAYPLEVQQRIINSIHGLTNARIVQPGYDVEYDFIDPTCMGHDLGLATGRGADGLFFAGQICGTTGYEEAAALGIIAGTNAALLALKKQRFVLSRRDGYIGVLVDDLVTRGTQEPYRVFTSRAEYRLHLRADNADLRLTPLAYQYGLVSEQRLEICMNRQNIIDRSLNELKSRRFPVSLWYDKVPSLFMEDDDARSKGSSVPSGRHKTADEILNMPRATLDAVEVALASFDAPYQVPREARDTVAAVCKYGAYLERQEKEYDAYKRNENLLIPPELEYSADTFPALSAEVREKLSLHRPKTFAEASRISGVTPASLVYLHSHVTSRRNGGGQVASSSKDNSNITVPVLAR